MTYEAPKTIKKVIDSIKKQEYVLPSIQREFVWSTNQIETLFDSLMRDYPIGTFLFWEVDKTKVTDFQFYEFLKKYHEKNNRHNQKFDPPDNQDVVAVLDGQQRMTSLYLALVGSYAYRMPSKARNNPNSYPERTMYLNLLKESDDSEVRYDFRFLTKEEAEHKKDGVYWFDCHKILSFKDPNNIQDYLEEYDLDDTTKFDKKTTRFARSTLTRLYDAVHKEGTVSFYMEDSQDLDKVLQIFIRINSRGTELSYSDLLLSIATAQWKDKDAREVIHRFVDDINQIGQEFKFNKDIVLRNCLVLAESLDIKFKAANFNKESMEIIEQEWEKTSSSLMRAIELVSQFGYNEKSLTATNAVIPISYFIYVNECEDKILNHTCHEDDRKAIKQWLARVLLKGVFGSAIDSIFPQMQKLIKDNKGKFPLQEIIQFYKGKTKSISFNGDDIDNLLEIQFNSARTYCALSLIYPAMNPSFVYHKDHIHPKSKFTKKKMTEAGFSHEKFLQFKDEMNGIANLQLLESTANIEKKDKPFKEWLDAASANQANKDSYLRLNHIDTNQSLEFTDFLAFVSARKKTIKNFLITNLGVTTEED